MERLVICNLLAATTYADAQPDLTGLTGVTGYNVLGVRGGKCLIKCTLPDGTPQTALTLADFADGDIDIAQISLTAGQKTAIRNWLNTNFPNLVTDWDGATPAERRQLVAFVIRKLFQCGEYLDGGSLFSGMKAG